jgi:hypothetical protein
MHSHGILNFKQSTVEGTEKILQEFQKYIPKINHRYLGTVVAGDCLTANIIDSTIHHLFNSKPGDETLEGMTPALGPFHLRVILFS